MKHAALLLVLVLALFPRAAANEPAELTATTFRFLRTESKTFEPSTKGQRPATVLYGVFAFRYPGPQPLKFWGFNPPSKDGKFTVRFPDYKVQIEGGWQKVLVGYCGTGATAYPLDPDTDYFLFVPVDHPAISNTTGSRVSASTESGEFWSDPFQLPQAKK